MNRGAKIVLDAGHGGTDSGGRSLGRAEKDLNLELQGWLWRALADLGYICLPTRVADQPVSLAERYNYANIHDADLFISIHCNASIATTPQGPWTIHNAGSAKGEALARLVQRWMANVAGVGRGNAENIFPDASPAVGGRQLAVLGKTRMPAILVEAGFMTHHKDIKDLEDATYQRRLMNAVALGVTAWTP